jgi:serine/threonine protein kinase
MTDQKDKIIIKKALLLETKQRTEFLEQLEEGELKDKVKLLLADEDELTQFVLKTSAASKVLEKHQLKDLVSGDRIKQFVIIKLIAKGGMGSVYLAYDDKLKRNVAIKTIRSEYIKNQATQQRFKQEAQILSQINHPSICQIYEYIDYDDGDILVLELVEGITLNNTNLDDQEKLDVFIQIASALEVAHNKGVIHRDLKPDNIMCSDENEIKVLDFGIAKSKTVGMSKSNLEEIKVINHDKPLTKMGTLMGTLLYMSPEQAEGKEVTTSSDIYSFGIIMQEILTGVTVYDLANTKDLKQQVINAQKVNIDHIPKEYQNLISSLNQKNPNKRLSAHELKQSLLEIKQEPQIKKRKLRNIFITVSTFSLIFILIYQWYNFSKEKEKSVFINNISNQIKDIGLTWDRIYTLPIHNITQDLANLKNNVQTLLIKIDKSNNLNQKERNLLKGRTFFAYKDYKKSLPLLKINWDENNPNPQLASELAMANMMTYYQESKKYHYNQAQTDKEFIEKINNDYYVPAQKYFNFSSSQTQLGSIPKALLLWHDKKEQQAIDMLKQLRSEQDWQFEIYQLEGEIMQSLSMSLYKKGDVDKAALMWRDITQVFKQASLRGRSFSKAYEEICVVENARISYTQKQAHGNIDDIYYNGIDSCEKALKIKPNTIKMLDVIAFSHGVYANIQLNKGKNPISLFEKSLAFINKSIVIKKTYRNLSFKAAILAGIAQYKNLIGENPDKEINQSISSNIESGKIAKNASFYTHTGVIWALLLKMERQFIIGENPIQSLKEIKQNYDAAISLKDLPNPALTTVNSYMALAYDYFANYQLYNNINPIDSVNKVKLYVDKSKSFTNYNPFNNSMLANSYSIDIKYKINNNINVDKELSKALNIINEVVKSNEAPILNVYAKLLFLEQKNKLIQGEIEEVDLSKAIIAYNQSIDINKMDVKVYNNLAELYLFQARNSLEEKIKVSLDLGINACDAAIKINPIFGYVYFNKAKLIQYGIKSNKFSNEMQGQVDELFKKANKLNPLLQN